MTTAQKILWLALAGALGTLARYGLSGLVQRLTGISFPWGTLAVNVAGCFLFGLIWAVIEERHLLAPPLRPILLIGFMGAFTTFSSFAFETIELMRDAEWLRAGANVLAQNGAGLTALFLGMVTGRLV